MLNVVDVYVYGMDVNVRITSFVCEWRSFLFSSAFLTTTPSPTFEG